MEKICSEMIAYMESINRAFSIHYCARSGSYLLQSLFDNHPNILSLPFNNLNAAVTGLKEILKESKKKSVLNLVNEIIEGLPFLFKSWNLMRLENINGVFYRFGAYEASCGAHITNFREHFYSCLTSLQGENYELDFGNILKAIFICYSLSIGREIKGKNLTLLLSLHEVNKDNINLIKEYFPQLTLLVCIREPLPSFNSHLRHHIYEAPTEKPQLTYELILNFLLNSTNLPNENVYGVKFEDVHRKTKETMLKLSQLLGLAWHPCLLRSTCDGKAYWWRSGTKIKVGTNAKLNQKKYTKVFSVFDEFRLKLFFSTHSKAWAYSKNKKRGALVFFRFLLLVPFSSTWKNLRQNFKEKTFIEKIFLSYGELQKINKLRSSISRKKIIQYLEII